MAYFRLLNQRSVEKALVAFFTDLQRKDLLEDFRDAAQANLTSFGSIDLPACDLLTPASSIKPYTWFIPKPKVSIAEFLRMYEAVANQPLSGLDTVGELASHIYPRHSDDRKFLAKFKGDDQWMSPALLMALASLYLGAEYEGRTTGGISLRLGPGLVRVNKAGVWSNHRRDWVTMFPADIDAAAPITTFPAIVTNNPVLRAMATVAEDSEAALAVTVVAHALREGVISKAHLSKLAHLEGPVIEKAKAWRRDASAATAALDQCLVILTESEGNLVEELFATAVPNLCSHKALQSRIGARTQVRDDRKFKSGTRAAWRQYLLELHEEAVNANS